MPISNRICLAVLTAGLAVQVGLLWVPEYLPFIDWPNHLARHELEARWLSGRPLHEEYRIAYRLLPNLGGDVVVPPLLLVFDATTASRLAWSLAVVLTALGPVVYVAQIAGRSTALTVGLLWLPWVFSSQLSWGFYNYYSGFGLSFLVLAHLEVLLRRPKLSALGLMLHTGLVTGLFFWHLAVWCIYGLLFAARMMFEWRRAGFTRFFLVSLATVPSLVACAAYFWANQNGGTEPLGIAYNYGDLPRKLYLLLGPFRGYHVWADGLAVAIWGAAVIVAVFVSKTATLTPARPRWLIPAAGVIGLAYLALPFQLGSTSDTDSRLIPALLLLTLIALMWGKSLRSWRVLMLVLLCLTVRVGTHGWNWSRLSARLRQVATTVDVIPPGSRVQPVILLSRASRNTPEQHFLNYGVISRDLRVPDLFAISDQQPLLYSRPVSRAWEKRSGTVYFDLQILRDHYDYVWVYDPEKVHVEIPPTLELLAEATDVRLYRVR